MRPSLLMMVSRFPRGRHAYAAAAVAPPCSAGMQVRRGVQVAPVRRADGGVVRRGAQPLRAAERGAAVPVQLPGPDPRHPGRVLPPGGHGRAPPPDPRHGAGLRRLHGAAARLPRRRRLGRARRRRVLARPLRRCLLRRGKTGDVPAALSVPKLAFAQAR